MRCVSCLQVSRSPGIPFLSQVQNICQSQYLDKVGQEISSLSVYKIKHTFFYRHSNEFTLNEAIGLLVSFYKMYRNKQIYIVYVFIDNFDRCKLQGVVDTVCELRHTFLKENPDVFCEKYKHGRLASTVSTSKVYTIKVTANSNTVLKLLAKTKQTRKNISPMICPGLQSGNVQTIFPCRILQFLY